MNKVTNPSIQPTKTLTKTTTRTPTQRHHTLTRPSANQRVTPIAQATTNLSRKTPIGQTHHGVVNRSSSPSLQAATALHSAGGIGFTSATLQDEPLHWFQQFQVAWPILRSILVVWASAVWILLVMLPGMEQISGLSSAMLHLPSVFIGLGLLVSLFVAYKLELDGHFLWFLGALLLLAGWM
ncbi:hypothetical protein [Thiolinea disciformis]|uniref:hypothetical protein n=1 Tax=Thiolinea disciformis TaxID=125614 RepID=UPI000370E84E|nr:hypothetical protein [Thiolinea disciformis]